MHAHSYGPHMTLGKNASLESYRRKTAFSHVVSHVTGVFFSVITASLWVGTDSFFIKLWLGYGLGFWEGDLLELE